MGIISIPLKMPITNKGTANNVTCENVLCFNKRLGFICMLQHVTHSDSQTMHVQCKAESYRFHCSCLFNQRDALPHAPVALSKPDHFYSELSCSID